MNDAALHPHKRYTPLDSRNARSDVVPEQSIKPKPIPIFRNGFNIYSSNTYFFTRYWQMVVAPYGRDGDIAGTFAPWNMVLLTTDNIHS
ncbi:hypothetical protein I302_104506 [Kwoniella bestiolae CBS 10118]|uniref:Uncharacterized protein n=1 Tax=Kwoniella bestiolae CBS 10118 TaxID=1296100 RepID=A0A1B9GBF9_9TREE|nr:hypothetical protein I302_03212 [Kwoniella bestiolae CBS 10118]OCF28353.1 hypothetical protein I302_03212 [Kwoniella bestiolae CBS 10118]